MKNSNLLSKAEMKKVLGGGALNLCIEWQNNPDVNICYNCCISYHQTQPPPVDPNWSAEVECDQLCNR